MSATRCARCAARRCSPSTAIITLALGIGANTAIFSAVSAVILRPLPFADAGRLVRVGEDNEEYDWHQADAAPANFLDWREQVGAFAGRGGVHRSSATWSTLTGDHPPRLLNAQTVTGNYFSVLGVRPEIGRTFTDEETWENGTRVVMISHRALARPVRRRGRRSSGRRCTLNGRAVQVIGVVPASYCVPGDGRRPLGADALGPGATARRSGSAARIG